MMGQQKKQLDRMEDMLTSLIETVGSMREEQTTAKEEQSIFTSELTSLKTDAENRHKDLMKEMLFMKADNDLLWEKYNEHDRELGHIRKTI